MCRVLYSLSPRPGEPHAAQLVASAGSLRAHNADLPVTVVVYGELPRDTAEAIEDLQVAVVHRRTFAEELFSLRPRTWRALAHYPGLHKWMSLATLGGADGERVLYVDCDTYFLGDVAALPAAYTGHALYAREEPHTRHSGPGHDPGYLDEPALSRLAAGEGAASITPCNTGVCLLDRDVARRACAARDLVLDYAWRLLLGLSLDDRGGADDWTRAATYDVVRIATRADFDRALPYPSSNTWIVAQVAAWLALGRLRRPASVGILDARHVAQGPEFEDLRPGSASPVVCHYFSSQEDRFRAWLRHVSVAPAPGHPVIAWRP